MSENEKPQRNVWNRINIKKHASAGIAAFMVIAASIIFAFCLIKITRILQIIGNIISAAAPILYGVAISYILKPFFNRMQKWLENKLKKHMKKPEKAKGIAKTISSIGIVLMVFLLIIAILAILLPELYNSVITLTGNLPQYIENARNWLHGVLKNYPQMDEVVMSYFDNITNMTTGFLANISPQLDSIFRTVTSGIGSVMGLFYNIFIGLIVAMYILNEKDTLTAEFRKVGYAIIKPNHVSWFREELRYADKVFSGFVFARFIDSILLGLIYFIVGTILQIPYAGMISIIIGVTNMIPFFGMYIGLIPSTLILLLVSPVKALLFVIVDIVIMQIDANLISPKIIGKSTSLSGFWVLFALLFFGGIWGFFGMLVGVPVFAVIYHQIRSLVDRRLSKREMSTDLDDYIRDPVIRAHEKKNRLKKMKNKLDEITGKDVEADNEAENGADNEAGNEGDNEGENENKAEESSEDK